MTQLQEQTWLFEVIQFWVIVVPYLITGDFIAGEKLHGNFRIELVFDQSSVPIATNHKPPFYWALFVLIDNGL